MAVSITDEIRQNRPVQYNTAHHTTIHNTFLTSIISLISQELLPSTPFKAKIKALQSASEGMCGDGVGTRTTNPELNPLIKKKKKKKMGMM